MSKMSVRSGVSKSEREGITARMYQGQAPPTQVLQIPTYSQTQAQQNQFSQAQPVPSPIEPVGQVMQGPTTAAPKQPGATQTAFGFAPAART